MEKFRITVPLSRDEFIALSKSAQGELRHPRDQARYLLRLVLLSEPSNALSTKEKSAVVDYPVNGALVPVNP